MEDVLNYSSFPYVNWQVTQGPMIRTYSWKAPQHGPHRVSGLCEDYRVSLWGYLSPCIFPPESTWSRKILSPTFSLQERRTWEVGWGRGEQGGDVHSYSFRLSTVSETRPDPNVDIWIRNWDGGWFLLWAVWLRGACFMSPPFSLIHVLSSSQMEVTSEEQIRPENCAQHEPKT